MQRLLPAVGLSSNSSRGASTSGSSSASSSRGASTSGGGAAATVAEHSHAVRRLPPPPSRQALAQRSRSVGLHSSLDLPEQLMNHWYPLEFSSKLEGDVMVPLELFGKAWVLFRDASGTVACVHDECAHRACPLSLGKVVDGQLECPYHGE